MNELCEYQNARCNDKKITMILCEAEPEYLIMYSAYDSDWTTEESGFDSLNNMRFFIVSDVYRSAPDTIPLSIQYVSVAIYLGI